MADDHEWQRSFVLTSSQSKRLIAKAIRRHPAVWKALSDGVVAVAKGTTNAYVVEELTGEPIDKHLYCTGTTQPRGSDAGAKVANQLPDLVLREGERVEDVSATEMLQDMGPEDVFIKGANALNYEKGQAGILIGHPTGGTIGAAIGTVVSQRINLMLPVGLEKSVPHDLHELYERMTAAGERGRGPTLWPVDGEVFTEIEALEVMCGLDAAAIGAGGIAGAEGSVRLSVWGPEDRVEGLDSLLEELAAEGPFI